MKRWLTLSAISLGVALRFIGYFRNRSLWFDEAALAVNIVERPLHGLFQPLEFHQGAPLGFLIVEKFLTSLLGPSEFALRLLPLMCGLLTVLLAANVARLYISPGAVRLAVALVALNPSLIYYSSEVKQYSSDALVALLLLWAFVRLTRSDLRGRKIVGFGVLGAFAVWCSHPAVFLLASAAVVLLISARADEHIVVRLATVFTMWAASFAALYRVSLHHLAADRALLDFWAQYFPPHPIVRAHTLVWLFDVFAAFFQDPAGLAILPGMGFCLIGFAGLFRCKSTLGWILTGSCAAMLLAAGMHRYPLGSRLLLFAVPIMLLLVAEGVATLSARLPHERLVHVAAACLVLSWPVLNAIRAGIHSVTGIQRDDIRPVIEYVKAHAAPSDTWYVYFQAQPQMRYYSDLFGMRVKWRLGSDCAFDGSCYAGDIDSVIGSDRVWIVLSHILVRDKTDDRAILVEQLDKKGRRLDEFGSRSAQAYLYDLRISKEAQP